MSLRPSRRNLNVVPKVKLGELQPLPEPVEEMAVGIEDSNIEDEQKALDMLSSLRLDTTTSGYTTPTLSRDESFDDDFGFDYVDEESVHGRGWQFSDDTGSSGFGNSVASFMSWTDDVEVETTRKVQELVDEFENCLFEEETSESLKKEVIEECEDWRKKFPHIRIKGTGIPSSSFHMQRLYENVIKNRALITEETKGVILDENTEQQEDDGGEEEIIASHGIYQEEEESFDFSNKSETSESSRPSTAESSLMTGYVRDIAEENLLKKVKDAVIDQLFSYVWSEVSKNVEEILRTLQTSSESRPVSTQTVNRFANPKLPPTMNLARAFTPIPDIHSSEISRMFDVTNRPLRQSGRKTSIQPSLETSFEMDETFDSYLTVDSLRHSAAPPIVRLPQPLSLHSANYVQAPMPTSELRGYHSAADRRTRTMLNRRFTSLASEQQSFLEPLETKVLSKSKSSKSLTPRQVSAPCSPPNWSRHTTLPPIEHLDSPLKLQGFNTIHEPNLRNNELSPRSVISTSKKFQCLSSPTRANVRNIEVTPRSSISLKQKISLSPIHAPSSIRIEGKGLSKIELAKQLLEKHEDLILEANGLTSNLERKMKQKK